MDIKTYISSELSHIMCDFYSNSKKQNLLKDEQINEIGKNSIHLNGKQKYFPIILFNF